jgi:SAM-dependent methyltransferase
VLTDASERIARIAHSRAFFGPRAAGWEDRFPDDGPAYQRAVIELSPAVGSTVMDVACGTGRALPALRDAVGLAGHVIALDITAEMLTEAIRHRRDTLAALVLADAAALPIASGSVDAVFAAGLLPHLPDTVATLRELARTCRGGARLALFHPLGRASLAGRHGHELDPADIRAEAAISTALDAAGWRLESCDDSEERYLVLATRELDI